MKYFSTLLLFLFFAVSSAEAASTTQQEFLKKFPVKEGHYDTVTDKTEKVSFCENEELDIALHEADGELVLTIGPKLVFPDLQQKETTSKTGKDCVVRTTNTLSDNHLTQVITETCGKKKNYQKTHVLHVDGGLIHYEFSTPGQKAEKCNYMFLSSKESPK
jgi:hypothetical protein